MTAHATLDSTASDHMHAWRRQIGHRYVLAQERGPRPFAVLGYRVRNLHSADRFVPARDLTLVILYDQWLKTGELATRLVGVGLQTSLDGLAVGGPQQSRFDKDLRLAPGWNCGGARLDAACGEFFDYALSLENYLERCARHPFMPRRSVPTLPTIDAVANVAGSPLVDLTRLSKRQVVRIGAAERDLVGRVGSTTFDFVNTRFRVAH